LRSSWAVRCPENERVFLEQIVDVMYCNKMMNMITMIQLCTTVNVQLTSALTKPSTGVVVDIRWLHGFEIDGCVSPFSFTCPSQAHLCDAIDRPLSCRSTSIVPATGMVTGVRLRAFTGGLRECARLDFVTQIRTISYLNAIQYSNVHGS